MIKRKSTFDKKYPLFSKYILDENVRLNMINNKDLFRKYLDYEETLRIFMFELEKRFDDETIKYYITEVIIKLPDITMNSFIESYLNSSDVSKSNKDILLYYKNTASFGIDATKYMERRGILTNRSYKEIPNILKKKEELEEEKRLEQVNNRLNKEYELIRSGEEQFNNVPLFTTYYNLNVESKALVNKLIINNTFNRLSGIYSEIDTDVKTIINLLLKSDIDEIIINPGLLDAMSNMEFMILTFTLMTINDKDITDKIKLLCTQARYDLIKRLTINDYVKYLNNYKREDLARLSDKEVMGIIYSDNKGLIKEIAS